MQANSDFERTQQSISRLLQTEVVQGNVAPHAVAGYTEKRADGWDYVLGSADKHTERCFDLASITKPFLAVVVASFVEAGELAWREPLNKYLPELRGTWAGDQSIESHLSHRAGMRPHIELFLGSWGGLPIDRRVLIQRIGKARAPSPGPQAVYSDLGYLLLGHLLETISGRALDVLFAERVLQPWGLRVGSARSMAQHSADFVRQVAPTEIQPGRGGPLRGVVHDDNAWMWAGTGTCGHAGLFGTAEALLRFGARLLEDETKPYLIPLLRRRPGGSLRMGFDGVSPGESSAGKLAGPDTFGHLGFTGTSLWCDPGQQRVTVLLTNRVYPTRENPKIRKIRPNVHDFLWSC